LALLLHFRAGDYWSAKSFKCVGHKFFKTGRFCQTAVCRHCKGAFGRAVFWVFLLPSLVFAYFADPKPLEFSGLKKPDHIKFIFWVSLSFYVLT